MICDILTGSPGCGKTTALLQQVIDRPGAHFLAAPRISLLDEHAARLHDLASTAGVAVVIEVVHSGQSKQGGVGRRLEKALRHHATTPHVVVLATHESLLALDPVLLGGWQVGLDELPDAAIASGRFSASTTWSALDRLYRLEGEQGDRWWRVVPRDGVDPLSLGEIARGARDQVAFHRLVRRGRPVFVDLAEWEQARLQSRSVGWWSLWTMRELRDCGSVTLTAATFSTSLVGRVNRRLHGGEINFRERHIDVDYPRAHPQIRIHFYVRHAGSTAWWESDDGSRCVVQISRHLEHIDFRGYWSCNATVRPYFRHRLGGEWCEPRQAGTNLLRNQTSCAYIYSNKAQESDRPILELFDFDREIIMQSRENEDIFQFAMRGAIRTPCYSGLYNVYLYSESQALALRERLLAGGITDQVEVIAVGEAGILDVTRPAGRSARTTTVLDLKSMSERRERKRKSERDRGRRRRAADTARMQALGQVRKRGRPRKSSNIEVHLDA